MITAEGRLHQNVADYLKLQYPNVIFRTDFAAGIKMTKGQAIRHKRLQSGRGYPDIFVAQPRVGYSGLFLELKAKGVYLKNGELSKQQHIQEQEKMLQALRELGYAAEFAVGFDDARRIIDDYMGDRL